MSDNIETHKYKYDMYDFLRYYTMGIERNDKQRFYKMVSKYWYIKHGTILENEEINKKHIKAFDEWRNSKFYKVEDLAILFDIEGFAVSFSDVFKDNITNTNGKTRDKSYIHYMSIEASKNFLEAIQNEDLEDAYKLKGYLEDGVFIPVSLHVVSYSFLFLYIRLINRKIESYYLFVSNKEITTLGDNFGGVNIPCKIIKSEDIMGEFKQLCKNDTYKFGFERCVTYMTNQEGRDCLQQIMKNQPLYSLHPSFKNTLCSKTIPAFSKRRKRERVFALGDLDEQINNAT